MRQFCSSNPVKVYSVDLFAFERRRIKEVPHLAHTQIARTTCVLPLSRSANFGTFRFAQARAPHCARNSRVSSNSL